MTTRARVPPTPMAGGLNTQNPPERNSRGPPPATAAEVCQRLRRECAIADVNPSNAKLLVLLAAGAQWGEFADAARSAAGKAKPFGYLLSIVERQRKEAADMVPRLHTGALPNKQQAIENRNRAVADQWLRDRGATA
jgi:hypothetical protein